MSDTSLLASDRPTDIRARKFLVLADAADPRVGLFQRALDAAAMPPARVIGYRQIAERQVDWDRELRGPCVLRIDSPGRDFETCRAILKRGVGPARLEMVPRLSDDELADLTFDKGRILCPRQWYYGFYCILREVEKALAGRDVLLTSRPDDILVMFDKAATHDRLRRGGLPVAPGIVPPDGFPPRSYEELLAMVRRTGRGRLFIKLLHGSSASGVVAYERSRERCQIWTTCEVVRAGGRVALYNSRRVRRCRDEREIAVLIDELCRHGVHVEAWVPKASIDGQACDLRVVAIGGRPMHAVVRMSPTPMTNLHLLNGRADAAIMRRRMSPDAWDGFMDTCARVASTFEGALQVGIDVAVTSGFRSHAVLEVNAFGDLLKGVTFEGRDTYAAELEHLLARGGGPTA